MDDLREGAQCVAACGWIRTSEGIAPLPVFKTGSLDHSDNKPNFLRALSQTMWLAGGLDIPSRMRPVPRNILISIFAWRRKVLSDLA